MLSNVARDLAVNLAGTEGHGERFSHVGLYRRRDRRVLVGRSDPYFRRSFVFKFAGTQLRELGTGNEREDDVGRESLLEIRLDAEGMCSVDEDARVLRSDDGFDDRGDVVHVRQCFYAQKDVIEGCF